MDNKKNYILSIDDSNVIKGFAICAMLIHHLFFQHLKYGLELNYFANLCKVCVSMFLFVSGYGMFSQMQAFMEKAGGMDFPLTMKFLFKRFLKFYLNYWFVFCICVPVGVFVFGRTLAVAYGPDANVGIQLIFDFLGLLRYDSYNITWWFNRLIIVLYLLFPVMFLGMKNKLISICTLLLVFLWPKELLFALDIVEGDLSQFAIAFALGMFCSRHSKYINDKLNRLHFAVVLGVSIALLSILCYVRMYWPFVDLWGLPKDSLITMFSVLSIICLRRLIKINWGRPFVFLGKHSMNMYLTHTFILSYFFSSFIYGLKYPILMFVVLLSLTLFLSVILEFLKRKIGFYKLQNFIVGFVTGLRQSFCT